MTDEIKLISIELTPMKWMRIMDLIEQNIADKITSTSKFNNGSERLNFLLNIESEILLRQED